jgi:hypothetical protein
MIATKEKRAVPCKESASNLHNTNFTNRQKNYSKQSFPFKPLDAKQTHQVLDSLLSLLQNKQIRNVKSDKVLPFALHELTVKGLREFHGFSEGDIKNIENSIIRDVENMRDFEIGIDAPFHLFKEFEKLDITDKLFDIRAVAIPGKIQNALLCEKLLKTFSAGQLLAVPGFVLISSFDEAGNRSESVQLDIDAHLCRRGFMMPVLRNGLITNLKVFRYPDDEKPFILRSRNLNIGGQNKW